MTDFEFMAHLQNEMLTQDHVSQADPRFWVVQGTERIYGVDEEHDCDGCVLVLDDGEDEIEDMQGAFDWLVESYSIEEFSLSDECITVIDDEDETILESLKDVHDYLWGIKSLSNAYLVFYRNVDKNYEDTMFLTNRECKEHIKRNHYHYPKDAHSYAMTAWRSPQVERLYQVIQNTDWERLMKEANDAND